MASTEAAAARDTTHEFIITRLLTAPRDRVFAAWTTAAELSLWAAPHGFTVTEGETDLRPGGRWWCCMRAPDDALLRPHGIYREIAAPERLVFTHAWEGENEPATLVTVSLSEEPGGTHLTLQQQGFEKTSSRDGHREGWSECLDRLADHLRTPANA